MQGNYRRRRKESAELFTIVILSFRFFRNNGHKISQKFRTLYRLWFFRGRKYFSARELQGWSGRRSGVFVEEVGFAPW